MPRTLATEVSVCVIGGGPAGSTLATKLSMLGHSVCIVDRAAFPRPRLGESLTPGVLPLLGTIGAGELALATGIPTTGVSVHWGKGEQDRHDDIAPGLLVDRARFDAALIENARQHGTLIFAPASILTREALHRSEGSARGFQLLVQSTDGPRRINAQFLADASGRSRALKGKRVVTGRRSMALYAYHQGRASTPTARIEAGRSAWYWRVPLPDGSENHLAFVDATALRALLSNTSLEDVYDALHAASTLSRECPAVHRTSAVRLIDATPYVDADCVGTGTIKVGDAALAIDPISSSGVQKAVQSALAAAVVVNTLLCKPTMSVPARQFYRDSLLAASNSHRAWAAEHYQLVADTTDDPFWHERAEAGLVAPPNPSRRPTALDANTVTSARVTLSPQLKVVQTPCLGDAFVSIQPAISHPNLERPCAYLGGVAVAPLLREVQPGMTPIAIARRWTSQVPLRTGLTIAAWLLRNGILVENDRVVLRSE